MNAPYKKSAEIYDAIYGDKDYAGEAQRLRELVQQYCKSGGNALLDVACGTGAHLVYLQNYFQVTGADISEEQLAVARKRLPGVSFHLTDMRSLSLAEGLGAEPQFDVVTCLFSSIGYMTSYDSMRYAIMTMAKRLKPGGVLFVEPWLSPDAFKSGRFSGDFVDEPDLKAARFSHTELEGQITKIEMHHLVGRPEGVEYFVEEHELALYTDEQYRRVFKSAGLNVEYDEKGLMNRGLYIGLKPL